MYPKELDIKKPEKTHCMTGFRINYLNRAFKKFQELLNEHEQMYHTTEWYDEDFWNEDREETLGFAFIACQIFITGSIMDSLGGKCEFIATGNAEKDKKAKKEFQKAKSEAKAQSMKNSPHFLGLRTKIELINSVANYYKHKDEGEPEGNTKQILDDYKLLVKEFPVNEAFELITEDNQLNTLRSFLINWNTHLFNSLESATTTNL